MKKLTTMEFIKRSKLVHGDLYDYSKTIYINSHSKVKIICKKYGHGIFLQSPNKHLQKRGCPKCFGTHLNDKNEFIEKAQNIHGNKYDYSSVLYIGAHVKVKIICKKPTHGIFLQKPANHITQKQGCPKCSSTLKLTQEKFIAKAKEVHGDFMNIQMLII